MQARLKDGSVMIAGICGKDADFKTVGEKESRVCTVGVSVGKRPKEDGSGQDTVWCNLKAWHSLASILAPAAKGDSVFAVGRLEEREHNGKTYVDLVAEFLSVASVQCTAASLATSAPPVEAYAELSADDGELPF